MFKRVFLLAGLVVSLLPATSSTPATAQETEIVLKAASGFDPGTAYSRAFERFVEFVNVEGKGVIHINYLGGGPRIMSIFEMGNALKTGVFDMLNTNNTFYTNLMPEADAIKLARRPVADLRKDGTWDYLNGLYGKRLNAHLLARSKGDVPSHFYLRKEAKVPTEPTVAMFKGLKIRSTPIYQPFLTALGADPVRMVPGDIYTGMQTGVIDGYGWPRDGIDELGLVPVTGYRIDPGVYVVTGEILINMNTWKKLSARQKGILEFGGKWLETWLPMYEDYEAKTSKDMQANAGIKVIEFKGAEGEKYKDIAYKAAWEAVMKANPSEGQELKSRFDGQ